VVKHSPPGHVINDSNPASPFLAPAENYPGQKVYKMGSGNSTVVEHSTTNVDIEGSNKLNNGQWLLHS
jgi:hypothetical protein